MAAYDNLVDLWFPIAGASLPLDHGFQLYSALCRSVHVLRTSDDWALHTVHGAAARGGFLILEGRPRFGLRLPIERVIEVLQLAGGLLAVGRSELHLGRAVIEPLRGWRSLVARLVSVRSFVDPDEVADALRRQLELMGVNGHVALGRRREIEVHGQVVVGFAVRIDDLTPTDSLHLQAVGLGARRRMGCGVLCRARGSDLAEHGTVEP